MLVRFSFYYCLLLKINSFSNIFMQTFVQGNDSYIQTFHPRVLVVYALRQMLYAVAHWLLRQKLPQFANRISCCQCHSCLACLFNPTKQHTSNLLVFSFCRNFQFFPFFFVNFLHFVHLELFPK